MNARDRRIAIANETVALLAQGSYQGPQGEVSLRAAIDAAVQGTREYLPGDALPAAVSSQTPSCVEVVAESTLEAGRRLAADGGPVAALVHASARNPGGGFLRGAEAQEEFIARSSALFPCLDGRQMYEFHRDRRDPLYTSWVIHCPGVPVFRDDLGLLLPAAWACSFLVSPAVNAGAAKEQGVAPAKVARAMAERIHRLLTVAEAAGASRLVLGA